MRAETAARGCPRSASRRDDRIERAGALFKRTLYSALRRTTAHSLALGDQQVDPSIERWNPLYVIHSLCHFPPGALQRYRLVDAPTASW